MTPKTTASFPKDRRVTVDDGTPIAYTVLPGEGRTPVVFVNGWSCSDGYWAEIGPALRAAGHTTVFVDARAHGESGLPRPAGLGGRNVRPEDVSVERMALDFVAVLDDAGLDRAAFMGHSMGVQTIFEVFHQAPERVAALVPVAGTFENPVRTFADRSMFDSVYPLADVLFRFVPWRLIQPVTRPALKPNIASRLVHRIGAAAEPVPAERLAGHFGHLGHVDFTVLWRMMASLRNHSTRAVLPTVDVPTLILAGRRDHFTPPSVQEQMASLVPGSELRWFERAGHLLPAEDPAGVAAAAVEFLARRVDQDAAGGAAS